LTTNFVAGPFIQERECLFCDPYLANVIMVSVTVFSRLKGGSDMTVLISIVVAAVFFILLGISLFMADKHKARTRERYPERTEQCVDGMTCGACQCKNSRPS
jgi:hypothetical protein